MQSKRNQINNPPNLLRGIVITVAGITSSILAITWIIINSKVEALVVQRTSEYAHSIARIAADSSSEALLSEDILQLNLLVENVAKDPYIRQATIYSEDGQIVSQYPSESEQEHSQDGKNEAIPDGQQQPASDLNGSQQAKLNNQQFIQRQKNIPFIEPIAYQSITAGWFKLEIDSYLLEKKFRDAYFEIQLYSGGIALVLFFIMLAIVFRLEVFIKQIAISCQHLLVQNKIKPPAQKKAWVDALTILANQHPQQLKEHVTMPASPEPWKQCSKLENVLICVFEFEIDSSEDNLLAENLSLAEKYLNRSIQAYGVQSQGDILTGCIVPFYSRNSDRGGQSTEQISQALCFIELVRKLMASLPHRLRMKTSLTRSSVLLLENEHELVTGLSLIGGHSEEVKKLLLSINDGDIISHFIDSSELEPYVHVEEFSHDSQGSINGLILTKLESNLTQQIARKYSYIRQS